MRSLLVQVLVSFLLVVAAGVGTVAYLAQRATNQEFHTYVQGSQQSRAAHMADGLALYYERTGSWAGVDAMLDGFSRGPTDRLVLADAGGLVVADSSHIWQGQAVADLGLTYPSPVTVSGKNVGELYVATGPGGGPVARGFRGAPAVAETDFLAAVGSSLRWAALVAGGVGVLLGLLLGWRVVSPLRVLTAGARRLAKGDLSHRVNIKSGGELGELANAFDSMAASLERNETARRNLLADIAHELRTPLTVIEGTADGILDGVMEPTRDRVALIRDEAALLEKLISDLRELSLAESGRLTLERKPLDIAEVAMKALDASEVAARQKGVELVLEAADGLPQVDGDEARLGQVIRNLLSNALRHTQEGGEVTVRLSVQGTPSTVSVSVADNGEGIPAEDLPHVFDRFYRADPSRARRSGGTGLGLAIVKHLVEAHGGQVTAESAPGQGSTFRFTLPAVARLTSVSQP